VCFLRVDAATPVSPAVPCRTYHLCVSARQRLSSRRLRKRSACVEGHDTWQLILYMAAFGSALTRSDSSYPNVCSRCVFQSRRQVFSFRNSPNCARQTRAHRSFQRQCKLFHQGSLGIRAQAASDIALPGSGGHAEDAAVLPEAGLLNPSVLNSGYDSEIIGLAIPALGSILLDPFMSLVDTGERQLHHFVVCDHHLFNCCSTPLCCCNKLTI